MSSVQVVSGAAVVFPGQDLSSLIEERLTSTTSTTTTSTTELSSSSPVKIQVGPGIIQSGSEVIALRAGILKFNSHGGTKKFSLISAQKRYIPVQNDLVIGIVTAKLSEFFRVDIGAQTGASLSLTTGFEGATKKNRPTWSVGTIIFARVALAHPDLEAELACFDPSGRISIDLFGELGGVGGVGSSSSSSDCNELSTSSTAMINEDKNTKIKSKKTSILLRTSCNFSKYLQNPLVVPLLSALGRHFAFEVAAGANGRIFLEAGNPRETVALAQIIETSEKEFWKSSKSTDEIEKKVYELAKSLGKVK